MFPGQRAAGNGQWAAGSRRGPRLQHPPRPPRPPASTGPLRFRGHSRTTARSSGTVSKLRRCSLPAPTVDPILSGTPEWMRYPQTRSWGPRWTPGHRAQHHLLCPGSRTQGGPAGPSGSQPLSLPGRERRTFSLRELGSRPGEVPWKEERELIDLSLLIPSVSVLGPAWGRGLGGNATPLGF